MPRWNGKHKAGRSLVRELTTSLIIAIVVVSAITITISYFNSINNIRQQQEQTVAAMLKSFPAALEIPLWNYDRAAVRGICESYSHLDFIGSMKIIDSLDEIYFELVGAGRGHHTEHNLVIKYDGKLVGHAEVSILNDIPAKVTQPFILSIITITLINLVALVVIIQFLLKRFLKYPMHRLTEIVQSYGVESYEFPGEHDIYMEFFPLIDTLHEMGGKISFQVDELRQIRNELEERVKQRTSQLTASNMELKRNIEEREKTEQEKRFLEDKLRQSEKMEALGLMAGGVAHDLNNILSGVIGYPELILRRLPENSNHRSLLNEIKKSGQRAADIVADLLTITRGIASVRRATDFRVMIRDYLVSPEFVELQSSFPLVQIDFRFADNLIPVSCSDVHIKKCVMNLVTNAVEAIDGAGTVTISLVHQLVKGSTATDVDIKEGTYVVLQVADSGSGISPGDLEHIFDPFYSKKVMGRSGTGLGLSVVWNCVQDHEGGIRVVSNDNGTCFELYFPANMDFESERADVGTEEALPGHGEKILIVDDEEMLRDLASKMLTNLGYTVETVASGEEAVLFLKKMQIDLVLLDMLMEPGMNGLQTYEKILEIHPQQKAIIASGFSESDDVKKTLQLGAGQYIKKPYTLAVLSQAVRNILD